MTVSVTGPRFEGFAGPTSGNPNTPNKPSPRAANVSFFNTTKERLPIGNASGAATRSLAAIKSSTYLISELSFVVIRIDHIGDSTAFDNAYMWINPLLDAEPDIANADAKSENASDFTFNRVRPVADGNDTGNGGRPTPELAVDELRLG